MAEPDQIIQRSELILVTEGEYSAYQITGLFIAKKQFNLTAYLKNYLFMHHEEINRHKFKKHKFLASLTTLGYLKEITCPRELYLGDYGDCKLVKVRAIESINEDESWLD